MPRKPGETTWDSDDDEDLLSDYRQEGDGGGGDVDIDENILDMSDAEIELMPPETMTSDSQEQSGGSNALFDHGYVTERVTEDEVMVDENGVTYQVVYTDDGALVDGQEVTIETQYDEEGNEISSSDQYVVVDEEGNVLQIVERLGDESGPLASEAEQTTGPDQAMDESTGESISVIASGTAIAMETNNDQDVAITEMEEDEATFEPNYGCSDDDDDDEVKRRSDRFTSERDDDAISANARPKRDIPDELSISSEEREKISRYLDPRKVNDRNDMSRVQMVEANYLGAAVRPAVPPFSRGRKILINPHFKPRMQNVVGAPVIPVVAWDARLPVTVAHQFSQNPQPMVQRAWQPVQQLPPNVVHHGMTMLPSQPSPMLAQSRPIVHPQMPPQAIPPQAMPTRPLMPPQAMAPQAVAPHSMPPRLPQQVIGPPIRPPYQPQFPQPGPPMRPVMVPGPGFRPPPQPMGPPQPPRPVMGPPMPAPPPHTFQGPPLQHRPPQPGPHQYQPVPGVPMNGARFQAPPNGFPPQMAPRPRGTIIIRQRAPGPVTVAGPAVIMRPRGQPSGPTRFIVRQRVPQPMTRPPTVHAIQTIVGGSTGSGLVHKTFKRVATVVTAAPPAKLIKLDQTPVATESDYERKLKEQAKLRARVQEQKELRRIQMAGQRYQEAENTLAKTGLSIETVINQQKQQPQAIQIASTNRNARTHATNHHRPRFQTPAGHVAGPGLVVHHHHPHQQQYQRHVPMIRGQVLSTEGGYLVGPRLVQTVTSHPSPAARQITPVQSNRTVIAPGGAGGFVRTTGVVHVTNMSPHTTRDRVVALAGSVGPTKCVAFMNSGKARVEFVHAGDAVKFYSRFNRKSLDNFVLQMTLS